MVPVENALSKSADAVGWGEREREGELLPQPRARELSLAIYARWGFACKPLHLSEFRRTISNAYLCVPGFLDGPSTAEMI